jgi:M6 family metalloprotease-like protein
MGSMASSHRRGAGLILAILAIISLFALAPLANGWAVTAEMPYRSMLLEAAHTLGWSATYSARHDMPNRAWQIAASDAVELALISVAASTGAPSLLDDLRGQGLALGLYRGREAVISRPGDPQAHGHGIIAWRCGPYTLLAEDRSGAGREEGIASALADAAEAHNLCGLPASLVIHADTDDMPGPYLKAFSMMLETHQVYYDANAYGRVDFALMLLDADGPNGGDDWFRVGPAIDAYQGQAFAFAVAAMQAAFTTLHPPAASYVDRAIIVTAGQALERMTGSATAHTIHLPNDEPVRITLPDSGARIDVSDVVLISWTAMPGVWVHELGHTLYSKQTTMHGIHRITDRYNDREMARINGHTGYWDLMGHGSRWGSPEGSAPTHMSSYSKEAAGWLQYRQATLDHDCVLTSLENQRIGDPVLTIVDPLDAGASDYYLLEARDADVPFGAPAPGVVVYHVYTNRTTGRTVVAPLSAQLGDPDAQRGKQRYQRPTLHGANASDGAKEYIIAGGVKITLLAESFAPYRATVRIERYLPSLSGDLLGPSGDTRSP